MDTTEYLVTWFGSRLAERSWVKVNLLPKVLLEHWKKTKPPSLTKKSANRKASEKEREKVNSTFLLVSAGEEEQEELTKSYDEVGNETGGKFDEMKVVDRMEVVKEGEEDPIDSMDVCSQEVKKKGEKVILVEEENVEVNKKEGRASSSLEFQEIIVKKSKEEKEESESEVGGIAGRLKRLSRRAKAASDSKRAKLRNISSEEENDSVKEKYVEGEKELFEESEDESSSAFDEEEGVKVKPGEKLYEVEKIVQMRTRNNKREFLIKWKGYGSSKNTWECERNLHPALVDDFFEADLGFRPHKTSGTESTVKNKARRESVKFGGGRGSRRFNGNYAENMRLEIDSGSDEDDDEEAPLRFKGQSRLVTSAKCDKCGTRGESLAACSNCSRLYHNRCTGLSSKDLELTYAFRGWLCDNCISQYCSVCEALLLGPLWGDGALKCKRCRLYYHKSCLKDHEKELKGNLLTVNDRWTCFDCTEEERKFGDTLEDENPIGLILDEREAGDNGRLSKEYFVKWSSRSHVHNTWMKERRLRRLAATKLANFQAKVEEEDPALDELKEYLPAWTTVERIVDARGDKRGREYFVKWKGLGYSQCTWEKARTVRDCVGGDAEIAAFKARKDRYLIRVEMALENRRKAKRERAKKKGNEKKKEEGEEKKKWNDKRDIKEKDKNGEEKKNEDRKKDKVGGDSRSTFRQVYKSQPSFLKHGKLYSYQIDGLNFLHSAWENSVNVILADEMGLGKTIQTIAYILSVRIAQGKKSTFKPFLVVAPLSVVPNWRRELLAWAPSLNVVVYTGDADDRRVCAETEFFVDAKSKSKAYKTIPKFDVLITNYELVWKESFFRSFEWESLIADEGHRLKSQSSAGFGTLNHVKSAHRVLLTGTPMQNNTKELFTLLHFLDPSHIVNELEESYGVLSEVDKVSELHDLLAPHILRRLLADVLHEVPDKVEMVVPVPLTKVQRELYKSVLEKNFDNLRGGASSLRGLDNVLSALHKVVDHPYLFPEWEPDSETFASREEEFMRLSEASGKMRILDKMLEKLKEEGHRVLVFSRYTSMLDIIEDFINFKGYSYARLDGSVKNAQRQHDIEKFQAEGSDCFVYLISTKAGGLGINLTGADTVIVYDFWFNPHDERQAIARAHRIGQKKLVYKLVTRHTVEEAMMERHKQKLALEHVVVKKMKDKLDQTSLNSILKFGAQKLFEEDKGEGEGEGHWEYDDAAIVALLAREKHAAEQREKEGETASHCTLQEDGLLNDFRIAPAARVSARQAESSENRTEDFWEELLRERVEKNRKIEPQRGRGMRVRKRVHYGDAGALKRKAEDQGDGSSSKRTKTARSSDESFSESSAIVSNDEDESSELLGADGLDDLLQEKKRRKRDPLAVPYTTALNRKQGRSKYVDEHRQATREWALIAAWGNSYQGDMYAMHGYQPVHQQHPAVPPAEPAQVPRLVVTAATQFINQEDKYAVVKNEEGDVVRYIVSPKTVAAAEELCKFPEYVKQQEEYDRYMAKKNAESGQTGMTSSVSLTGAHQQFLRQMRVQAQRKEIGEGKEKEKEVTTEELEQREVVNKWHAQLNMSTHTIATLQVQLHQSREAVENARKTLEEQIMMLSDEEKQRQEQLIQSHSRRHDDIEYALARWSEYVQQLQHAGPAICRGTLLAGYVQTTPLQAAEITSRSDFKRLTPQKGLKRKRDPSLPKRATRAVNFFIKENYDRVSKALKAEGRLNATQEKEDGKKTSPAQSHAREHHAAALKALHQEYRTLPSEERVVYEAKAKADVERYAKEMETYKEKLARVSVLTLAPVTMEKSVVKAIDDKEEDEQKGHEKGDENVMEVEGGDQTNLENETKQSVVVVLDDDEREDRGRLTKKARISPLTEGPVPSTSVTTGNLPSASTYGAGVTVPRSSPPHQLSSVFAPQTSPMMTQTLNSPVQAQAYDHQPYFPMPHAYVTNLYHAPFQQYFPAQTGTPQGAPASTTLPSANGAGAKEQPIELDD